MAKRLRPGRPRVSNGDTGRPTGFGAQYAYQLGRSLQQRVPARVSTPTAIRPTLAVSGPITHDEIQCAIKSTKKGTAPGPDGRGLQDVRVLSLPKVCRAFKSCLLLKDFLESWAKRRTPLIPQKPAAADPGDFRPITITSLLLRLFIKL